VFPAVNMKPSLSRCRLFRNGELPETSPGQTANTDVRWQKNHSLVTSVFASTKQIDKKTPDRTMIDVRPGLARLLAVLPLFAEEGETREVITEADLIDRLGIGPGELETVAAVAFTRALFESLGLLDQQLLSTGQWAFVSFPASLAGRSLLAALSTPGHTLVEPHYWQQGAFRPKGAVEEQRRLLHELETRRVRFHPAQIAQPIRTVHVAWGVIKIGGRFLMHLREDDKRPHEKNFVLPGGRLNLCDLPPAAQNQSSLRDLFEIDSALAAQSLTRTLVRELEEECGLTGGHWHMVQ